MITTDGRVGGLAWMEDCQISHSERRANCQGAHEIRWQKERHTLGPEAETFVHIPRDPKTFSEGTLAPTYFSVEHKVAVDP